ncbi:MAG: hypothetical protein RI894_1050 [Bacteroidota bacterium]|jgi:hypothetical protein
MNKSLALLLFMGVNAAAWAQNTRLFTYHNDHKVWNTDDVIGCTFVPNERETSDGKGGMQGRATRLAPGDVVIKVLRDYLYVTQNGEEAKYSVNQITTEKYGFKLSLMDARNPSIQGHLKVIRDENKYVRDLVFKRSREDKEIVFRQAEPDKRTEQEYAKYFTNKDSVKLKTKEAFWKKSFHPFFQVSSVQTRLYKDDDLSISFTQDTVIVKKAKIPTAKDSLLIAQGKKKAEKDKIKIIEQIHLRYMEQDENNPSAARKEVKLDYEIASISRTVNNGQEEQDKDIRYRYELKLQGAKADAFLVFLTEKQTVSVVVIGEFSYLMQGM